MKKSELIKQLELIPGDPEVAILDWLTNLDEDSGEGSKAGIYPGFEVEYKDEDEIPEGCEPWIALSFQNEYIQQAENVELIPGNQLGIEVKTTDKVFYTSPESGHPDCKCSRCDKAIPEDESPILRMWPSEPGDHGYDPKALGGTELRYCWACSKEMGVDFGTNDFENENYVP